ncbi:chemotaxis protein CheW [Marinomonas atlantica]|uniref:chemotaxis protein CheW n=1 Tax=Marinomonas atlantica TaxID=1806668 RepID=UPI00082C48A4|nr:chemotaxis protein CheW [Marinomonas atlantica]MCO4784836.1 chemotaxis protein CheW [Marinomonas atlantica]
METVEKGICFRLGEERYIHPLHCVKEVLSYQSPSPALGSSPGVEGMIEVRGNMVTVLYGSHLLGINPNQCDKEGHIVVIDLPTGYFGVRVESVERVMDLPDSLEIGSVEYRSHQCIQGTMLEEGELYIMVDFSEYCSALN